MTPALQKALDDIIRVTGQRQMFGNWQVWFVNTPIFMSETCQRLNETLTPAISAAWFETAEGEILMLFRRGSLPADEFLTVFRGLGAQITPDGSEAVLTQHYDGMLRAQLQAVLADLETEAPNAVHHNPGAAKKPTIH